MRLKNLIQLVLAGIIAMNMIACQEDENNEKQPVEDEEALTIISSTLTDTISGVYSQMGFNLIDISMKNAPAKNAASVKDSTKTFEYNGPNVSFLYNLSYSYDIKFAEGGTIIEFTYSLSGNYEGPRIQKTNEDSAWLQIGGYGSGLLSVNGSSTHSGNITLKNQDNKNYQYTIEYTYTDISIATAEDESNNGTVNFEMSGTTQEGEEYAFNGQITMQSGETATVTLNGTDYELNLVTGEFS